MLRVLFINPSIEKIFKELEFIAIFVFIVLINSEKHISLSKRLSPISLIAKETLEFKSKTISKIKNEKFMQIPNKTIFIIKLNGWSILWKVMWDIKYLNP